MQDRRKLFFIDESDIPSSAHVPAVGDTGNVIYVPISKKYSEQVKINFKNYSDGSVELQIDGYEYPNSNYVSSSSSTTTKKIQRGNKPGTSPNRTSQPYDMYVSSGQIAYDIYGGYGRVNLYLPNRFYNQSESMICFELSEDTFLGYMKVKLARANVLNVFEIYEYSSSNGDNHILIDAEE